IGIVTMSHGYGLSVTPLQLAHAYATIGAFGIARPVSFLRVEGAVPGERALATPVCRELVGMLESVVAAEGTGKLAAIPGYRVSGKRSEERRVGKECALLCRSRWLPYP